MTRRHRTNTRRSVMKKLLMVAVATIGFATAASAATVDVKVPFPFKVEGKTMPAGTYRIQTQGEFAVLENQSQHVAMIVLTRNAEPPVASPAPALAFTHEK